MEPMMTDKAPAGTAEYNKKPNRSTKHAQFSLIFPAKTGRENQIPFICRMPCTGAMPDLLFHQKQVIVGKDRDIPYTDHCIGSSSAWLVITVKQKTQYFMVPGRFTTDSLFLIKFDGRYSYWGSRSRQWICDPTLFSQARIRDYSQPITEREVRKIIKEGAAPDGLSKKQPQVWGTIVIKEGVCSINVLRNDNLTG